MMDMGLKPGLEGVVAAETRLSSVDGLAGELIIAGFPLEEIAGKATFEEMLFLLWFDRLPLAHELADFQQALAKHRSLPSATLALLQAASQEKAPVIDALRMAASTLSLQAAQTEGYAEIEPDALRVMAAFPTMVAAYWRLLNGQNPVEPRADLPHAANYLAMLFGQAPSPAQTRALETYLNTVMDHGLNASTFTVRVIISTQSDLVSAVVGALGALKGPLHGGAPGPALDMVFEIGTPERSESVLREKIECGERLMGFGHRIYKVRDPRADMLALAADLLYQTDGDKKLYELALHVEQVALNLLEEYKPGRNLQTNVEFYTALVLHGLHLPTDLFTPTFAIARAGGWIAHCFEQRETNRIIRPQSVFVGEKSRRWTPLESR